MGEGVINVQVGSQTTLSINLYDYIEYNESSIEISNKINLFLKNMSENGEWKVYTNLISDIQPNYELKIDLNGQYSNDKTTGKDYRLGYDSTGELSGNNYYFNYNGLNVLPIRTHLPEEKYYYFVYEGYFRSENGVYVYDTYKANEANKVSTKFVLNVYTLKMVFRHIFFYCYKLSYFLRKANFLLNF